MMTIWEKALIADVLKERVTYGIVQPGSHEMAGVPVVRAGDISRGLITTENPKKVSESLESKYSRTRLSGGEVLLSLVGTVGESAVVPRGLAGWNVARAVGVLRPDRVSADWLHICLQSENVQQQLREKLNTTVQATLNLQDLAKVVIPVPVPDEQRAIAEVLGALDDKIAANASLAEVADDLVRTRYDALLATARENWKLGDLATMIRNQIRPESVAPTTIYVGLEHLARRSMWLSDSGSATDVTSAKSKFVEGDVLFGKLRPYFHKVVLAPVDGISSTDILVVRAREKALAGLVLAAASSDEAVARCSAASEGTRMPRANWKDLDALTVPWPGDKEAEAFSTDVLHIARLVATKMAESATLAETRGALLPLLMSGKVRVKDVEKIAEEAL